MISISQQGLEPAECPVQPEHLFVAERLGAGQDGAGPLVHGGHRRFSSSVKVMIRSVRISSISVPSKSSPGLSGAIWG